MYAVCLLEHTWISMMKKQFFSSSQTSHSLDADYMLLQPPLTCLLNTPWNRQSVLLSNVEQKKRRHVSTLFFTLHTANKKQTPAQWFALWWFFRDPNSRSEVSLDEDRKRPSGSQHSHQGPFPYWDKYDSVNQYYIDLGQYISSRRQKLQRRFKMQIKPQLVEYTKSARVLSNV